MLGNLLAHLCLSSERTAEDGGLCRGQEKTLHPVCTQAWAIAPCGVLGRKRCLPLAARPSLEHLAGTLGVRSVGLQF